jgi:hypothetical protein
MYLLSKSTTRLLTLNCTFAREIVRWPIPVVARYKLWLCVRSSWLSHYATSRKVVGSIPDYVIGIFHWHNTSDRTVALGHDSASNRNEYQGYFLGDKGGRCVELATLPSSCADCLEIWEPQPPGNLRVCSGLEWDCFICGRSIFRMAASNPARSVDDCCECCALSGRSSDLNWVGRKRSY